LLSSLVVATVMTETLAARPPASATTAAQPMAGSG
jgi:hypothetical protein